MCAYSFGELTFEHIPCIKLYRTTRSIIYHRSIQLFIDILNISQSVKTVTPYKFLQKRIILPICHQYKRFMKVFADVHCDWPWWIYFSRYRWPSWIFVAITWQKVNIWHRIPYFFIQTELALLILKENDSVL